MARWLPVNSLMGEEGVYLKALRIYHLHYIKNLLIFVHMSYQRANIIISIIIRGFA
jgi:hypothetical protein